MVGEWLQELLILQDRDSRCDTIKRQLEDIPFQIRREEGHIRELGDGLAVKEQEMKELEARRLGLEGEVEQAEAMILKYKTQQLQVKKNEEYTALEHEIAALKGKISDLEDTELGVLEQIDLKKAQLTEARESVAQQRQTLEAHIARLRQNYESFAAELSDAHKAVEEYATRIAPAILQQYRYVKSQVKRPPVVVPLEETRCKGCHLKVSGEIESAARKGHELVRCDSCGRILYHDP